MELWDTGHDPKDHSAFDAFSAGPDIERIPSVVSSLYGSERRTRERDSVTQNRDKSKGERGGRGSIRYLSYNGAFVDSYPPGYR